jgi:signal transduction histidine kinase
MKTGGVYSLKQERLSAERQQAAIRLLMAVTSSLLLIKYYADQNAGAVGGAEISLSDVRTLIALLMSYSIAMWALIRWKPEWIKVTTAVSSVAEVGLITYLIRVTAKTDIPFQLWYVFYVVSVATRYGWQYSMLALSASIVTFTLAACIVPSSGPSALQPLLATNVPAVVGFTAFLLVLAFMFGRISEKQLNYQASLAVVNEFRAELADLVNSREIIDHMLSRVRTLLKVEEAFFLPARRGADASEAPGLRSAGASPTLLSTFREGGGTWNVERILAEQRPLVSNNLSADPSFPEGAVARLGLRNLAAAPMMVRAVPVGAVYAANRRDKSLSTADLELLELIATQAAPVVENALLWERLTEAAASEERLRIARDLHDNFLQTLAAIKLHLERCKILVTKDPDRALEGIERIHQISTRGLAEVRAYLSELRLMGPEPSRFRQAVERCASDVAARGGFGVTVEMNLPDEAMPPNVALAAFQIVRELLNNVATHSHAAHVNVRVDVREQGLVLEVEDDGRGFDVSRVRAEKASEGHLGLVGVEERAKQLGGTFTLVSEVDKGTRATAVIPL